MLDPSAVPDLDRDETLARFVYFKSHLRASDNSIRPEAFMPHPYTALSVTRHREATDEELWNDGRRVAAIRGKPLYGRADTSIAAFDDEGLRTVPDPVLPENPNHASVLGWPNDKAAQKDKALQIAIKSQYLSTP